MATLHIENTVKDFATWKEVFDKFDRFRAENGVRSYRLSRLATDQNQIMIDLHFDDVDTATSFRGALEKIWATPQSREQLVEHSVPAVYQVVEDRELSAAAASTA
jgi:ribose 5-phosphate isomerase